MFENKVEKRPKGGRGVGGRGVGDGSVESAPMAANIPSFLGMLM